MQLVAPEEEPKISDVSSSDYEIQHTLSKHVRCASHTLSLVATSDAKNALKTTKFSTLNHAAMGKCSAVWNKSGRPKSAEIIKEYLECSLRPPCNTRWNSLYDALALLLKHKDKLNQLFQALEVLPLKSVEVEFIEEYACVLAPIANAIDHLQGEEAIFYGHFLPTLLDVQNKLNALKSKQLKHCAPLLQAVLQGFQTRFHKYLHLVEDPDVHDAMLAATTHPFFKLRWVDINKAWDRECKMTILKNDFRISAMSFQSKSFQNTEEASSSEEDAYDFGFEKKSTTTETSVEMQVMTYLNDSDKSIDSLQRHPLILKMFLR